MIKVWRLLSVAFVVAVCLGLMLVPSVATPGVNAAGTVGIEVVPSVTKVECNQSFDVNLTINDTVAQDMAAWTVYMTFNNTLMNVTGIDRCTMLPTGHAPDDIPGYPKWDNATGIIDHQSGTAVGDPYVNTSFVVMTVHCRSNAVAGIGSLAFANINPLKRTWVEDGDTNPVLNWTKVVNGTVKVGPPTLTVNVTPADMGTVKVNGTTLTGYPNTTNQSWDANVTLEAVDSVPNWTFTGWSGDLTGSDNTTNITMDWDKNVTANFILVGTTATLEGHVNFAGRGSNNTKWAEPFVVKGFESGNLSHVLWTTNATTNYTGVFTLTGIDAGTYDIGIKNWTCLSEVNTSVTLTAGNTTVVNFGTTREGDSNNDDIITGADRSLLYSGWGKSEGEAGYNIHCDFNRDGSLTGADRSLMYAYWAQHGDLVS